MGKVPIKNSRNCTSLEVNTLLQVIALSYKYLSSSFNAELILYYFFSAQSVTGTIPFHWRNALFSDKTGDQVFQWFYPRKRFITI